MKLVYDEGRCRYMTYEEEGGNKCDWDDGLAHGELRSTSDPAIVHTLPSSLFSNDFDGRGTTTLLIVDLIEGRLLGAIKAEKLHLERYGPVLVKR
jgi:hypothetical protein